MEIQEIKQQLNILEVLSHYGLKPNRNKMLCCPFHDDKKPSMQVYPESNTVFCFSGNCDHTGKPIDQIDFILHKEGITKRQAILKVKEMTNGTTIQPNVGSEPKRITRLGVFSRFWQSCKSGFTKSPKARAYLESRCIGKVEAGYCSEKSMKDWGKELRAAAEQHGLLKNGKPHFGGCLVFPILDMENRVTGFYGRKVNGEDHPVRGHYYLSGSHEGIYPKFPEPETKKVVLTESVIDCATLKQQFPQLTTLALYGTNGFTADHEKALKKLTQLEEVVLFFDGDAAGEKGAEKISEKLKELLPKVILSKVVIPEMEDINSLAQGHEPEVFSHLLKNRKQLSFSNIRPLGETEKADPITETLSSSPGPTPRFNLEFLHLMVQLKQPLSFN